MGGLDPRCLVRSRGPAERLHDVVTSQEGSFRQRRLGLAYRLHIALRKGRQVPVKRVPPDPAPFGIVYRGIQRTRLQLQRVSRTAFADCRSEIDNGRFLRRIRPWIRVYRAQYRLLAYEAGVRRRHNAHYADLWIVPTWDTICWRATVSGCWRSA